VNFNSWPFYPRVKVQVSTLGGWDPGPVWTGLENRKFLALCRVRTLYFKTHSEMAIYTISLFHIMNTDIMEVEIFLSLYDLCGVHLETVYF